MWGAIAQAAASTNNTIASTYMGAKNLAFEKENLAYLKQVQQKTWDREDNSVQRRTRDLKAAGLSPVLAAGQGASTMAPIKTDAPQANPEMGKVAIDLQQLETAQAQLGQIAASTNASKTQSQANSATARRTNAEARMAEQSAGIYKRTGVDPRKNSTAAQILEAKRALQHQITGKVNTTFKSSLFSNKGAMQRRRIQSQQQAARRAKQGFRKSKRSR